MNTKREIVDVFDGRPGDEPPPPAVFTQTGTVGQMDACGARWPDANFELEAMVTLALQFPRMFGFATVRVPYCLTVEASTLGATVYPGRGNSQPSITGSPFIGEPDMGVPMPPTDLMDPDEFVVSGRCAMVVDAVERISREHEDLFLTAGMVDPIGIVAELLGIENVVIGYLMDPDATKAWVKAMAPYSCSYAKALSEHADNITIIGSASLDIFTPEMYDDLTAPYLREQISNTSCFSTVHSCGMTMDLIDELVKLGADGLSLEASSDPEAFLDKVAGRCLMFGSVNPIYTLLMGTSADVTAEARKDAELGFDIITPECGVPPMTPNENLMALSHYRGE